MDFEPWVFCAWGFSFFWAVIGWGFDGGGFGDRCMVFLPREFNSFHGTFEHIHVSLYFGRPGLRSPLK
jgi:hypothetical protein